MAIKNRKNRRRGRGSKREPAVGALLQAGAEGAETPGAPNRRQTKDEKKEEFADRISEPADRPSSANLPL